MTEPIFFDPSRKLSAICLTCRWQRLILVMIFLLPGLLLAACQSPQSQSDAPAEQAVVENLNSVVGASGLLVPRRYANLSLSAAGVVAEIMAVEGQPVEAGQPLLRLVGGDPENPAPELQAAINLRTLELQAAQQALDSLDEQAEARAAQARQTLNSSSSQIRDLQYTLAALEVPDAQADLTPLAAYDVALSAYQSAEAAYAPYRDAEASSEQREAQDDLAAAQADYDLAITRLQLSLSLQAAQANYDQARLDWEKYRAGPVEDDRQQALLRLESAQTSLQAAQAALESLTLLAPFSGSVTTVQARVGEWVAPGVPVMVLADLSELQIETTDLNEIDLVRIAVGDPVQVYFDAWPEATLDGQVTYIASQAAPGSGVTYKVIITLDSVPEQLRWGMSAFIDILLQE